MSWARTQKRSKATDQGSYFCTVAKHLPRLSWLSLDPTPYLCLFSMVVQAQMRGQIHIRCQELTLKAESSLHSLRQRKGLCWVLQQLLTFNHL